MQHSGYMHHGSLSKVIAIAVMLAKHLGCQAETLISSFTAAVSLPVE